MVGGEAVAICSYDALEMSENGVVESGYLPLAPGDCVKVLSEPTEGHAANRSKKYLYGSVPGRANGWVPADFLKSAVGGC